MEQSFKVYGLHAVESLLNYKPNTVVSVWLDKSRHDAKMQALVERATEVGCPLHRVPNKVLDELVSSNGRHQGVVAECQQSPTYQEQDLYQIIEATHSLPLILVLDGVQDPHNLGACLRTADASGVHAVVVPKDKAVGLTATVRKVASGAAETVPFVSVTNLSRTLKRLKELGLWVIGTCGDAETSLYEIDCKIPLALVMGSEGKGMRRLTREHCDYLVKLPLNGTVESLNVSVATGVSLYEILRQRL